MKSPRGPVIVPSPDERERALPQRWRVYRQVLRAIREGVLTPGARLPSSRQLAADWRVARGAVDEAYEHLQVEGLVERRVGDGSYVAATLPAGLRTGAAAMVREPSAATRAVLERLDPLLPPALRNDLQPIALRPSVPEVARFPLPAWKRCIARAIERDPSRAHLGFGTPAGLTSLRELTAQHLALSGAAPCRPEQIIIVNSNTQAFELVARVLLTPGDAVAMMDPGHASTARLLALQHLQVHGIASDAQGLSVAALRRQAPAAAAVFLTCFNQYPTGVVTTAARGAELMRWADESGAWIVDTQFMREIAHDGPPPAPLALHDAAERVLTVGSWSAVTFPSLRMAYLVVPERLVDAFTAVRGLLGDHSPTLMQAALAEFIQAGHAGAHLRAMSALYRARRDVLLVAARRHLPSWAQLGPTSGGFNALLELPPSVPDRALVQALHARGVASLALSDHAWQVEGCNGLVLGYGAYEPAAIEAAVAVIGELLAAYQPTGENR